MLGGELGLAGSLSVLELFEAPAAAIQDIAVDLGLDPVDGVPLAFISYVGSPPVVSPRAIGLVVAIPP